MKRIAIEAQRVYRAKKHGMDFVAINYVKALAENYPDQNFIVFAKKGADKEAIPQLPNIKFCFIPKAPYPIWEQVLLPLYCLFYRVSVLHCTSNTAPIFPLCKLVITLHDVIFMESNPLKDGSSYQKFGNLYRRWIVPIVVKRAKKIITVSHYEKSNIAFQFPKEQEKIEVIYNAANDHFKHYPAEETISSILAKYKLPEHYFLFLGNTDPKKNVSNIFTAFLQLWQKLGDECPFMVVPDYPESWLQKWYEQNNAPTEFQKKIFCSGYIANTDLQAILSQAKAFLYPSKRESFGIPILEGYWSKVPVITSDAAAMPEVAGDAALLIDPLDPTTICDAMSTILKESEELRNNRIDKGLERAATFSWITSAKQLNDLYKKL